MENIIRLIINEKLIEKDQITLNQLKKDNDLYFKTEDKQIYKTSLYTRNEVLYCIIKNKSDKAMYAFSFKDINDDFKGEVQNIREISVKTISFSRENCLALYELFPFTRPVSLREKKTTFGCGDRLGLATAGHIRAFREYDLYPVLAQQSIRELTLTNRTYSDVTIDTAFLVFQEGFQNGYGADGDHLKTIKDIDTALESHMPMITLDLSDNLLPEAADWEQDKVNNEFESLDSELTQRLLNTYNNKQFKIGDQELSFSENEIKKCTHIYTKALDFAKEVNDYLHSKCGNEYDLEISIDETTTPTLPAHHLFIISELIYRKVQVNSLAPRFIGEFQKGIDYIGDLNEFSKQFKIHCDIAKAYGNYKISVHSGSDKFSVYPKVGEFTNLKCHVKTAGTSWLEAVRCISKVNPELYRKIHKKAYQYFPDALKLYHITCDLEKIKPIDQVSDEDLPDYLEQDESRQLLHITYGGLLNDPEIKDDFFNTLHQYEEDHYQCIKKHILKHIKLLGVPKKTGYE